MSKARNGQRAVRDAMGAICDDAAGVGADVRDLGDAVKDVLIEKLGDMLKKAVSFAEHGKEAAATATRDVQEGIEERIRRHPFQTLLIAGGAGLLIGFLVRRK